MAVSMGLPVRDAAGLLGEMSVFNAHHVAPPPPPPPPAPVRSPAAIDEERRSVLAQYQKATSLDERKALRQKFVDLHDEALSQ